LLCNVGQAHGIKDGFTVIRANNNQQLHGPTLPLPASSIHAHKH
jgi:hypothetical protein